MYNISYTPKMEVILMKFCEHCGAKVSDDARFCSGCGAPCAPGVGAPYHPGVAATSGEETLMGKLTSTVNAFAGGEGAVIPPLREIFSETFRKHTNEEAEEIFICGTKSTTPELTLADTVWPKPWLYGRIMLAFLVAFIAMHLASSLANGGNAIIGVIILGAFTVPVGTMVFFFELNTPRNISFYNLLKVFLVGGCASLLFTLLLFNVFDYTGDDAYIAAIVIGIVEEIGKAGIVAYFIAKEKNIKYYFSGLLIGAAVGAGFAAFESAAYALNVLSAYGSYDAMIENIFLRGVLAPGGHVVWAAMEGYAFMLAKGDRPLNSSCLQQASFWKVVIMPVAMHSVWDMFAAYLWVLFGLVALSWVVIFVIINNCLKQLGRVLAMGTAEPTYAAEPPVYAKPTYAAAPPVYEAPVYTPPEPRTYHSYAPPVREPAPEPVRYTYSEPAAEAQKKPEPEQTSSWGMSPAGDL